MIFGIGENKKTERRIWDLITPKILSFEKRDTRKLLTENECQAIANQFGYTVIYLKSSKGGVVFQWYTFDSPPFVYEFTQFSENPSLWSLSIIGTKEFNRLVVRFFSSSPIEQKLKETKLRIFSVSIDDGPLLNNDGRGEKTESLTSYLLSVDGYYDGNKLF